MNAFEEPLEPVSRGDLLVERAYQRLRDAILANHLPPGTALSVPEFARRLQVSRSPIREAVQRLVYDGLAVNVAHKGAEVATLDFEELLHLYEVREVLEGLAARLATERIDAAGLERLRQILAAHEEVLVSGDERGHIEMDMAYHLGIREAAGNDYLSETLERIHGKAHLAYYQLWRGLDDRRLALSEHRKVFEAMVAGDAAGADQAARNHIIQLRVRLSQHTRTGRLRSAGRAPAGAR
jgi:DNA-binding GntR family transcriptional regulator